jgi:membrane protein DedA with SNARE-associated domain
MHGLLLIALATLISEDLTCIATGVLVAQGKLSFVWGTVACLLGIFVGDLLLFLTGRVAGRAALRWTALRKLVSPSKLDRAAAWLSEKGMAVILLSRFTPGLRLTTYFAAGLLRTRFWRFASMFLIASAIWTPLLVGSTAIFGEQTLRSVFVRGGNTLVTFVVLFAATMAARKTAQLVLNYRTRRLLVGFLKRKIRWEFWPPWAAYLPVVPYLMYLAVKNRSLTLFTAANPGMPSGGFVGESKSQILQRLSQCEGAVAGYSVIPAGLQAYARLRRAREFMAQHALSFPVVLKPDVGERGAGVAVIRSERELDAYLRAAEGDTIIQQYVDGLEFGVFYYCRPGESHGRIFSITEKRFPGVTGDGKRSVAQLILQDPRAVCLAKMYLARSRRPVDEVPARGESVSLVEIGSHCRGSVFLDGSRFKTLALEEAIDRVSHCHSGFFLGRYDIRTPSIQAFQEGRGFKVIELNGVSAEATHIYDPAVSLLDAYQVLFRQWRLAFEIGAMNRKSGVPPMPVMDLWKLIWMRLRRTKSAVAPSISEPVEAAS